MNRTKRLELTARQAEAVELLAVGLTYSQIADRLGVATRTAEDHIRRVAEQLGGDGAPSVRVVAWYWASSPHLPYTVVDDD